MPSFTPVGPAALAVAIAERAAELGPWVCVAISAADAAAPLALAEDVAARLRVAGRAADIVSLHDFVRPASLRLERGHSDPDSYRWDWFDYDAVDREVVRALHDQHRWLPRLWDETSDRSARAQRVDAPEGQVLIVAGPMLHGRGPAFDLTVHLTMSRTALERRTLDTDRWTVAPLLEHDATSEADIVVRYDHPDRPAMRTTSERGS
jgi:hypothetical protein